MAGNLINSIYQKGIYTLNLPQLLFRHMVFNYHYRRKHVHILTQKPARSNPVGLLVYL